MASQVIMGPRAAPGTSDEQLVALVHDGDERALNEIVRRYERPLRSYCAGLVGRDRAEDAVQQAFVQALVALRREHGREVVLRPWLYRIARNCSIDLLRKDGGDHDQLDPEFDGVLQPPALAEQREEIEHLVAALRSLPEGQRRALTLREFEGRSYREIAGELGQTASSARQLIFRARSSLRGGIAALVPLAPLRSWLLGFAPAAPETVAVGASVSGGRGTAALDVAAAVAAATVALIGGGPAGERETHAAGTGSREIAWAAGASAPRPGSGEPPSVAVASTPARPSRVRDVSLQPRRGPDAASPAPAVPAVPAAGTVATTLPPVAPPSPAAAMGVVAPALAVPASQPAAERAATSESVAATQSAPPQRSAGAAGNGTASTASKAPRAAGAAGAVPVSDTRTSGSAPRPGSGSEQALVASRDGAAPGDPGTPRPAGAVIAPAGQGVARPAAPAARADPGDRATGVRVPSVRPGTRAVAKTPDASGRSRPAQPVRRGATPARPPASDQTARR